MPSHKSHKSSSRKSKPFYTKNRCQSLLKKKISINMKEYNEGKFVSRPQAVAVSYSQVRKSFPGCKGFFGAKSPKKSSRKVSKKVSRKVSKKVSKKVSRKVSRKVSKKVSRKVSRKISPKRSRQSKKSYKFQEEYPY
jgi:hypothetical protein